MVILHSYVSLPEGTMYKAYLLGLNFKEYPHKLPLNQSI